MAINTKVNNDTNAQSVSQITNQSFDQKFQVNIVELCAYDSVTDSLRRVTVDGLAHFGTNNVEKASSTLIYEGLEDANEVWQVVKTSTSGDITTITFATQLNNATVTSYADAWSGRADLSYGTYGEAF